MFSAENIQAILADGKDSFIVSEQFGLGQWIRNNWIYGDMEGQGLFAPKEGYPVFDHPDHQSSVFLEKYYEHLKRIYRSK